MRLIAAIFSVLMLFSEIPAQEQKQSELPPGDKPPMTVIDRVKEAGTAKDHKGTSYIIVYDSLENKVTDRGVTYTDQLIVYKIFDEKGCRDMSVQSWHYEPMSSAVEVKEVNLIRDGARIPVPLKDIKDLPAPQSGIYWQDRIKLLQLPRLQINDAIEIKTFRKGFSYALLDNNNLPPEDEKYIPPMPGEYFDIILFQARVPIIEKRHVLKLPADKRLHSETYNGPLYARTTYNPDTTIYSWWAKEMPAWKPGPSSADASDMLPKVVLATVESWEAKSRWFFEINNNQFDVTEAIQAKVDDILASAGVSDGTELEKAFELVHWVAQNIRYSGQTMGEGEGFTLHPGQMIFEQRSGVCKDIAGMLVTMMRAAGLDSYAAMTMAGSRIEEIPADQFNHCVVALKTDTGKFVMYDPTWVPYYKDIWSLSEAEQHYLIGTPEGDTLSRIPYSPPEESPLYITNNGEILSDGTLEATVEMKSNGKIDGYLRGMVYWFRYHERTDYLLSILGKISDRVEIVDFEHGDILDFHESMWWRIKYRIPEYALPVADGFEFKSPLMQMVYDGTLLFRYTRNEWGKERKNDLFFYSTQLLDGSENLRLPNGYEIAKSIKAETIDETYAYFSGQGDMDKNRLTVKSTAKVKRRQIPTEGYEGFRKAMQEAKDFAAKTYRVEKGGAR